MVYIITRKKKNWQRHKDGLHRRRKELAGQISEGLMTKSEMNRGEEGEPEFDARVAIYDRWKKKKEPLMKEWSGINREFKKQGEEGKPQSVDAIRETISVGGSVKYE